MIQKTALLVWVAFLVSTSFLWADEVRFQTTSDEMVKELTRPPVKYRSFASKKRTIAVAERINNKMEKTIVVVDENLDVPKLKIRIEFDYDSSALKKSSYTLLNEVGTALISNAIKDKTIMINGHTDSDGTQTYNLKLSFDRADSVKAYLVAAFNLPEERLQIRGYGELLPLKPNTIPYNKQINRRVEFEIVNR
ncbi:OmpA family protein [Desulfobacula phenolica]|uniref:OmpA family protein n=1 Tax=Desulfobacula phenolica TaxID=90732 RepID=A0A1H2JLA9_9BACT|nr:OmpA family protein [Desulfobacula phenolica]SDU57132.1 OmpA family protein [Desulfobacula phenolica]